MENATEQIKKSLRAMKPFIEAIEDEEPDQFLIRGNSPASGRPWELRIPRQAVVGYVRPSENHSFQELSIDEQELLRSGLTAEDWTELGGDA